MAGPLVWWANRKSKMGLSPAAKAPPHPPGKAWWTDPPVSAPEPAHIEYAVQYMRQIQLEPGSSRRNYLQAKVSDWLRGARRILHERVESQDGDLHTTDGLFIALDDIHHQMIGALFKAGAKDDPRWERWNEVCRAVSARASAAKRQRALKPSADGDYLRSLGEDP